MKVAPVARALVVLIALSACRVEERADTSDVTQEVNGYCELFAEQMTFCAFPNVNGFGCLCDRDLCLELVEQCEPDPRWRFHCYGQCLQEAPPQPPFDPSTDCEELLENHSLPHWHICHYPRCWDLEPGETCIVPMGGGGGPES